MDPDLQLASFGNPEIETGLDCDVAVVWNALSDWDSRSPTFDDGEVMFLRCMRIAITSLPCRVGSCCLFFEVHALQISFWNVSFLTITFVELTALDEHCHSVSPHLNCSHLRTGLRWEAGYPHQLRCTM